jgi:hypothetical protein
MRTIWIRLFTGSMLVVLLAGCNQAVHNESDKPLDYHLKSGEIPEVKLNMKTIPDTKNPLVLRMDFTNEKVWQNICKEIMKPDPKFGFHAYVAFYDDKSVEGRTLQEVLSDSLNAYAYSFIFIADSVTISTSEYHILCVGLNDDAGKQFRLIPSALAGVENNLSISNMDFDEFVAAVDKNGIFRGFN